MIPKLSFPIRAVESYRMLYSPTSTPLAVLQATGAGLAIPGGMGMGYCQEFADGAEHCAVTFVRQQNQLNIEYLVSLFGTSCEYNDKILETLIAVSHPSTLLVHEEKKLELISALGLN